LSNSCKFISAAQRYGKGITPQPPKEGVLKAAEILSVTGYRVPVGSSANSRLPDFASEQKSSNLSRDQTLQAICQFFPGKPVKSFALLMKPVIQGGTG